MEECWNQDCPNWAGYLRNNCRAWWTELAKNCKDYLKAKTESGAQVPCTGVLCGIDQAAKDYNDDMDRLEKTLDLNAKPISERKRERLINRSCGD